jgi:dienelactone hydrolase
MRIAFLLFLFIHASQYSSGQITASDSLYLNSIFTESPYVSYWNYPGTWFHHQELTSVQDFYNKIDSSYQFYNNEFADCYQKIHTSNTLLRDTAINATIDNYEVTNNVMIYGNKNPFVKLPFSLNNKTSYSYAVIDSSSAPIHNNDQVFVIISGTGSNLLKQIIDGNGYHDLNCYVRNLLKPHGDIFVMSAPNEDHRALVFNTKKPSSLPSYQPPYLINYLNAENKALGLNRIIETVAFIKYLKTTYKKVFVLGLSAGGTIALWSSLLAEPDATLVASGYSVLVDNDFNSQLINSMSYGNYLLVYDKDSTKNRLAQLHTQFLFTQAQNDNPLAQADIDSSSTKNYFASLGNTSFFSDYTNHSFPPCNVIDSFLQRCMSKPKVFISVDSSLCNKDSTIMRLHFDGKAPFTFDLFKNNALIGNYTTASNDYEINILNEGRYYINNILDSLQTVGYSSDTFHYRKTIAPSVKFSVIDFDCISNQSKIEFEFTGTSPFKAYYNNNNTFDSLMFNQVKDSLWFENGDYAFLQLKDAKNCILPLDKHFTFDHSPLSFQLNSIEYDCIFNKNDVSISLAGTFPIHFIYYDSVISSYRFEIIHNNDFHLKLDSGKYHFISLADSNNCTLPIDSTINISNEISFNQGIYKNKMQLKATNEQFSKYYWYLNNQPYKETTEPYIDLMESGKYQLGNYSLLHCLLKTPSIEIDLGKINIYPNPVSNIVNIFISLEKNEIVQANITDITGKVLRQKTMRNGLNQWNIIDLPKGIYLISFDTNMESIRYEPQKLLKN